jgi:hypothetical protein
VGRAEIYDEKIKTRKFHDNVPFRTFA